MAKYTNAAGDSKQTESELTRKFCKVCEKAGIFTQANIGGAVGARDGRRTSAIARTGMPDRLFHTRHWTGWVEFKREDTPLKDIQQAMINKLNAIRPGSAWVVRYYWTRPNDSVRYVNILHENNYEYRWYAGLQGISAVDGEFTNVRLVPLDKSDVIINHIGNWCTVLSWDSLRRIQNNERR